MAEPALRRVRGLTELHPERNLNGRMRADGENDRERLDTTGDIRRTITAERGVRIGPKNGTAKLNVRRKDNENSWQQTNGINHKNANKMIAIRKGKRRQAGDAEAAEAAREPAVEPGSSHQIRNAHGSPNLPLPRAKMHAVPAALARPADRKAMRRCTKSARNVHPLAIQPPAPSTLAHRPGNRKGPISPSSQNALREA